MLSDAVQERKQRHQDALAWVRTTAQEADRLLSLGEARAATPHGLAQPRFEGGATARCSHQTLQGPVECCGKSDKSAARQQQAAEREATLAQAAFACAHAEARNIPSAALQGSHLKVQGCADCNGNQSVVVQPEVWSPVAMGALAEMDLASTTHGVHDMSSCKGPWYFLESVQSSIPLCSETALCERHSGSLLESLHTDADCAQIAALMEVPAFAVCLPRLREGLVRLQALAAAPPAHAGFDSLSHGRPQTHSAGHRVQSLEQRPQGMLEQPVLRTCNTAQDAAVGNGAAALGNIAEQEEVEAMWASVAPPDNEAAAFDCLGAGIQVPGAAAGDRSAWHSSRVVFLGTGSSEPSKYRAPSGILLQVCASNSTSLCTMFDG
jgi:hypothetical protein